MSVKKIETEIKLEGKTRQQLIEFLEKIPDYARASTRSEPYHDARDQGGTFLIYKWVESL